VGINNNLLLWSSVIDPSRDGVDSFPPALRRRRNVGELDGWAGAAFLRMASLTRKVETQSANYKDERPCEPLRRDDCGAPCSASRVPLFGHIKHHDLFR
jgi:hypothetical protein